MVKSYIPEKGDLIIVTFDPQAGHEQKGRRPALVVSNYAFNKALGMAMVCPVTSTDRNFPFHVQLLQSKNLSGYIMTEQVKSIDYNARKIKYVEKVDNQILHNVMKIIEAVLF